MNKKTRSLLKLIEMRNCFLIIRQLIHWINEPFQYPYKLHYFVVFSERKNQEPNVPIWITIWILILIIFYYYSYAYCSCTFMYLVFAGKSAQKEGVSGYGNHKIGQTYKRCNSQTLVDEVHGHSHSQGCHPQKGNEDHTIVQPRVREIDINND